MKKRILLISVMVIVLVLSLFAFVACNDAQDEIGQNLILNGDFSDFDTTSKKFTDWRTTTDTIKYGMKQASDNSDTYLYIENSASRYAYLKQTVNVSRNAVYKVSVDIMINSRLSSPIGAYVTFLENVSHKFVTQRDVTNGFMTLTFYVSPKNVDTLTLALCIGSQETGCQGTVYFDNVSMMRVNSSDVPAGETIVDLRKATNVKDVDVTGTTFVVMLTLLSVVVVIVAYIVIRRLYARKNAFQDFGVKSVGSSDKGVVDGGKWYNNVWFIAVLLMLGTFVIRLIIMLTTYGFGAQMTALLNLGRTTLMKENGLINYFANNPASTYSPGTLYIVTILGAITQNTTVNVTSILFRLINVLADMAVVAMIYFYGRKQVGNKLSTVYAALYAVLPLTFVISGFYAGFESLLISLMVGAMLLAVNKKYISTYFVMSLATVLDMRAMAIAPIIVAYFVYMYIKDDDSIKKFTFNRAKIVFGLIGSFVVAYLISMPIGFNQIVAGDAFFNFKVMMGQITKVTYYTNNAFGLYGMVTMNGKSAVQGVKILNLVFLLVLEAYAIALYFRNRNRQELIMLASFVLAVIAVFTIKVTYTYLVLSLALALIYTMVSGDKRMYAIIGGIATLGFLNIGQLMNKSGLVSSVPTQAIEGFANKDAFYITFSVISVIVIAYYAYVCYSIANNAKIVDIKAMDTPLVQSIKNFFSRLKTRLSRTDEE